MPTSEQCTKVLHHLSRIQGQIDSLKAAIEDEQSCEQVANLTSSILRSFDSARANIIEGYIQQDIINDTELSADKADKLKRIVSLYKA